MITSGGVIRGMDGFPHAVGGMGDHVHVFAGLRATHCLADVMREIKSESSCWIHKELQMPGFGWQEGYGAFTVGASSIDRVRTYVLQQQEHHRTTTSGICGHAQNAVWSSRTSDICGSRCAGLPVLALLPERSASACRGPVVALGFTTGYQLSSLQLDK